MSTKWKTYVFEKAERVIETATTPLPIKEMAWRSVRWVVACGQSHPVSFALRPIADHRHLRLMIGVNLAVLAIAAAVWGPLPTVGADTGGVPAIVVLPEGEVKLATQEAVIWPIPSREISQGFWLLHAGIDIRTSPGTPVKPAMAGKVTEIEVGRYGYGEKVVISHQNGYKSLYAHLSRIDVEVGNLVTTETVIGLSGNTGRSTGPHLHLEIRDQNDHLVNPLLVLEN